MKKYIIFIVGLTLVISFLLGLYMYRLSKLDEQIAFEVEYKQVEVENIIKNAEELLKETSSIENTINPTTKLIEKRYYNYCEHLIETVRKIDETIVNKDEVGLQTEYIGWEIQKFTPKEVVVYKEINEFCDEHYLIKEVDGKINVYKLDRYNKEKELIEQTNIETKYLSEMDIEKLKKGIKAYGNTEVNEILEDFE